MVVDTSLVVKWSQMEEFSVQAAYLLREWTEAEIRPIVPSWFACEFANVLFQRVRDGRMGLADAQDGLREVLSTVTLQDIEPTISVRALAIADHLKQRASYDAQYLALAEHLGCELWTADQRFWRAAKLAFPRIRWVGEVSSGAVS